MGIEKEHRVDLLDRLDSYDTCELECDGLTRVLSYLLTEGGIPHTVWIGEISDTKASKSFDPHLWIELPDGRIIDYRARMWLGSKAHIPHGIFTPEDYDVTYTGKSMSYPYPDEIAVLLLQISCSDHAQLA